MLCRGNALAPVKITRARSLFIPAINAVLNPSRYRSNKKTSPVPTRVLLLLRHLTAVKISQKPAFIYIPSALPPSSFITFFPHTHSKKLTRLPVGSLLYFRRVLFLLARATTKLNTQDCADDVCSVVRKIIHLRCSSSGVVLLRSAAMAFVLPCFQGNSDDCKCLSIAAEDCRRCCRRAKSSFVFKIIKEEGGVKNRGGRSSLELMSAEMRL